MWSVDTPRMREDDPMRTGVDPHESATERKVKIGLCP